MRTGWKCQIPTPGLPSPACYVFGVPHLCVGIVALGIALAGCDRGADRTGSDRAGSVAPIQRVISLTPSATEVIAALGATSLLVGVDEFSKYPTEVAQLPHVGSFLSPNLEVIVRLRPTLVIVDDVHRDVAGALHDAGLTTVDCAMHDLADVKRALVIIGDRLDRRPEADRAVAGIDAAIAGARPASPARRPRVLAIIDRESGGLGNLVAAGPGSWVDELVAVVGGDNVLVSSAMRYPKLSMEEVLRTRPEVILDLSFGGAGNPAHVAAWNGVDVPAVRDHRVFAIHEPFLLAPSPRVAEALRALSAAIRAGSVQ